VSSEAGQIGTLFTWNAICNDSSYSNGVAKSEIVTPADSQSTIFNTNAVAGKPGHFEYSKELLQLGEYSCRIVIEFSNFQIKIMRFQSPFPLCYSPCETNQYMCHKPSM